MTSPDERRTAVGFRNGAFTADHPTCVGHPRAWGNGIPIKIAWALKPRSEFWAAPGDTCAWVSVTSINRASQSLDFHLLWKTHEEKMICGQQLNFPYTIMGEMHETLITEKMKNAQFQQWNFVNIDETQNAPLCNFLNSGYRTCGIE